MIEITKEIKERQLHLLVCVQNAIELTGEDVQVEFKWNDEEPYVELIHWIKNKDSIYEYGFVFCDGLWTNMFPLWKKDVYESVLQQLDEFTEIYRKGEEF